MAHTVTSIAHTVTSSGTDVLASLAAPFRWLGRALVVMGEQNTRMRQVAYLQGLTDEELAQRGLKRDEIVSHVFQALYYV